MKAFAKLHPTTLFSYFIVMLLFSMFIRNPVTVALSLTGGTAFACTLTGRDEKLSDLKFYLPLTVLITVTNPLFSHNGRTPLFFVNGNAFTLEAIWYGLFIAVMIVAVLLWSKSYSKIVTGDIFLYLFGRAAPKTALILSVALRYVPMLKHRAASIRDAQKTLGVYSTESRADRLTGAAKVYSALVGWSLENAVETGRHMRARGWGHGRRTSFSVFRFRAADAAVLLLTGACAALVVTASAKGYLAFGFYPDVTPLPVNVISVCTYACFGILALLPFAIETEEMIRWNLLRSGI